MERKPIRSQLEIQTKYTFLGGMKTNSKVTQNPNQRYSLPNLTLMADDPMKSYLHQILDDIVFVYFSCYPFEKVPSPSQVTKQVDWEGVINLVFVYLRPAPAPTNVSRVPILSIKEKIVFVCM